MATMVYRVVSACGALGYGFPKASLERALEGGVDAVISDAGSMDAGPYFLGTGNEYFEREAVKADYRLMVEAGVRLNVPVIIGSCGMAGGNRNLEWMLDVAREVFAEVGVRDAKVAVIPAELEPATVVRELERGALKATGDGPIPTPDALRTSTIVGQMGVHPIVTALNDGAQFVFAGRACDVALFAADMIRRGIDAGLAYHVGHVLECGALACDPGTPSDCLVAEVYDDNSAVFVAPDPSRRCTPYSIAAHSLYEESHPQLQFYPEGVLVMDQTEFFAVDERTAGIRKSRFAGNGAAWPTSIKLEGARRLGKRMVSLVHVDPAHLADIPANVLVYGRNGVEAAPIRDGERELGLIVETTANTLEDARVLASLLTHYLLHYGYPGRKATAGNIAYPLSPNLIAFERADGTFGAIVPSGTRDPVFFANYPTIRENVIALVQRQFPDAMAKATFRIIEADASAPAVLVRNIDDDATRLAIRHAGEVEALLRVAPARAGSLFNLVADDAYEWSLYHLLEDEALIRDTLFPIRYYRASGGEWVAEGTQSSRWFEVAPPLDCGTDERTLSVIAATRPAGNAVRQRALGEIARVIRSKDAGINRITFDLLFNDADAYETALDSGLFSADRIAAVLGVEPSRLIGTYFVDSCQAIKISLNRPVLSASPEDRDVFGAQQQAALLRMRIPEFEMAAPSPRHATAEVSP